MKEAGRMEAVLSADLGTSKICAAAVGLETGLPLAVFSSANDADVPGLPDGWHEQDAKRIVELALGLLRQAAASAAAAGADVRAIGISGQMHGCVLIGAGAEPTTNLVTWRDRRTAERGKGSLEESLGLMPEGAEGRCGCRMSVGYGAAMLRWMLVRRLVPQGPKAVSMAGLLAARLSGRVAVDEAHAASWGIYDLEERGWHGGWVSSLGLQEVLPEVVPDGHPLGTLKQVVAEELGIGGGRDGLQPDG